MQERPDRARRLLRGLGYLALSTLLHAGLLLLLVPVLLMMRPLHPTERPTPITLLDESGPHRPRSDASPAQPKDQDEAQKEKEEEERKREQGQIVDVAPPVEERRPDDARFLSEHDITVEQETRTDRFRLDSDVRSPTYSPEDAMEFQSDVPDVGATAPSSGGPAGSQPFEADRDGRYASLPEPYRLTNKVGLEGPVPAGSGEQKVSGSPSNDLVDAKLGDRMSLNTKEVVYAAYINRIKRVVSFYWNQNLDNLPRTIRLSRSHYDTVVYVVLDDQGGLESVEVTDTCGEDLLDDAVVQAFRAAGPFPNPPEALISKDGRVHLDDMGFTVQVGSAVRAPYAGVDPRSGVQFPGILKATH